MYTPENLWAFLPLGYLATILTETPVLLLGLSPRHSLSQRLVAGIWLTACTYPIVVLVLPLVLPQVDLSDPEAGLWPYYLYLTVAEIFAPAAECLLFYLAFIQPREEADDAATVRDLIAVTVANLASFLLGLAMGSLAA